MRKFLLGTTALVAAVALARGAHAEAPLTVTLGGGLQVNGGLVSEDLDTDRRGYGMETDTAVLVGAEGKAGNFTYGVRIDLYGDQNLDQNSDEVFGYIFGDLGRLEVGDQDGAGDRMVYYAPNGFGTGGIDGDYSNFYNVATNNGRSSVLGLDDMFKVMDSDDATKITYFSPRFAGFQFGASYSPDGLGSGSQLPGTTNEVTNVAAGSPLDVTSFENFYEIGVNYVQTFNAFNVAIGAEYVGASAKNDALGTEYEDLSGWGVGTQIGYMGFTLGGGYVHQGNGGFDSNSANDDENKGWNVGLQYETGPFTVGANALFAEGEGLQTVAADNEFTVYSLGATYNLAPGLDTYLETTLFDYQSEAGTAGDNEGSVIILGTALEF
jgi:hypothetical protein